MNEGQTIVQMLVGLPSVAAMPVASPGTSLPLDGGEPGMFAGLLRDLSSHANSQPVVGACAKDAQTGSSDSMGTETASEKADTPEDVMAILLAMADAGKNMMPPSPTIDGPGLAQIENIVLPKGIIPQNVVLPASEIQAVQAQQISGRMPESAVIPADNENVVVARYSGTADAGEPFRMSAVVMPAAAGASRTDTSAMRLPNFAILADENLVPTPTTTIQQDGVASNPVQQEIPTTQAIVPSTAQPTVDNAASRNTGVQDKFINDVQEAPVKVVSAPELAATSKPVNTFVDTASMQTEAVPVRSTVKPVLDAYFNTSAAPSNNNMPGIAPAEKEVSPLPNPELIKCDTGVTNEKRVSLEGKRSGIQVVQETQSSKADSADAANSTESQGGTVEVAIKKVMTPANGESSGQDGKGTFDKKTGAQDTMMLLHQMKVESTPTAAGAPSLAASDTVRTNVIEQVVNHLAGRDIKSGSEQVVIRLSPENLGELKLNLRMENQGLKVEIVAENSAVRDMLLQHSDTLKETLARQNITMEAFDVSTGSNRGGSMSHGHGEWQELAQQQQHSTNNSGRYRMSDVSEIPQKPLYHATAEHSMLDVHF